MPLAATLFVGQLNCELGGLKQTNFLSHSSGGYNLKSSCGQGCVPPRPLGEFPSLPFPASGNPQMLFGLWQPNFSLCLHVHVIVFPVSVSLHDIISVYIEISPFLWGPQYIALGLTLMTSSSLAYINKDLIFQNKVIFQVPGVSTSYLSEKQNSAHEGVQELHSKPLTLVHVIRQFYTQPN